jgi:ribonuclease HII
VRRALGWRDRQLLRGVPRIVGVDEVGRGALAGPVVVAGVAFERIPVAAEVQDSKVLTRRQRERAAGWIRAHCAQWAVVEVGVDLVDRLNILEATRCAMRAVARTLATSAAVVVVDAVELGLTGLPVLAPRHADARFFAVAAASIVAKVHRDSLLVELAGRYPAWGWERNVGYPSREHRQALVDSGLTFLHRRSFRCVPAPAGRSAGP